MTTVRLTLVRHARPDGTWGHDPDPGLDTLGREQAHDVVSALASIGPLPIVVSPLRRTRETAAPLAAAWGVDPRVEPGIGELTAPADAAQDAGRWLRALMAGTGVEHAAVMAPFRERVLRAIRAVDADSVIVTHFLAINAIVGAATDDDRVVCFSPGHCSRTTVESDPERNTLRVLDLGISGDGTARVV